MSVLCVCVLINAVGWFVSRVLLHCLSCCVLVQLIISWMLWMIRKPRGALNLVTFPRFTCQRNHCLQDMLVPLPSFPSRLQTESQTVLSWMSWLTQLHTLYSCRSLTLRIITSCACFGLPLCSHMMLSSFKNWPFCMNLVKSLCESVICNSPLLTLSDESKWTTDCKCFRKSN